MTSPLSPDALQLAAKLADSGPTDEAAQAWVAEILAEAWEQGYSVGQGDERRGRACPGTSGCDCTVPTTNPYDGP